MIIDLSAEIAVIRELLPNSRTYFTHRGLVSKLVGDHGFDEWRAERAVAEAVGHGIIRRIRSFESSCGDLLGCVDHPVKPAEPDTHDRGRRAWMEDLRRRVLAAADDLLARVGRRLEAGAREYGDASFARPVHEVLGEILDERADILGWGFVAYVIDRERQLHERQTSESAT